MKKLFLLMLVITGAIATTNAQTTFLDRVKNTYPGVKGKVTFEPQATLKVSGHDDYSNKINAGATFELLSRDMIQDNIGLYTIKIKILDDNGTGKHNGKIGFMYPASTNLTDYTDYTEERIVGGPTDDDENFMDRVSNTYPGVYGKVTFSPQATLKISGHDDYSNKINEGATFELLSRKMVKDNIGLYTIKIKIIDDNGTGKHNGKIGYMYPASTTMTDYTDYTDERIVGGPTSLSELKSSGGNFLDRVENTYPGVKGKVTFEPQATLKITGHDDYSTKINAGATFELLSRQMIQDNIGLYTIKIKIIDDNGTGKHNGKIGYMYPASTNLTDYTDYTNERIEGGPRK